MYCSSLCERVFPDPRKHYLVRCTLPSPCIFPASEHQHHACQDSTARITLQYFVATIEGCSKRAFPSDCKTETQYSSAPVQWRTVNLYTHLECKQVLKTFSTNLMVRIIIQDQETKSGGVSLRSQHSPQIASLHFRFYFVYKYSRPETVASPLFINQHPVNLAFVFTTKT